jgi:hypothetical protein
VRLSIWAANQPKWNEKRPVARPAFFFCPGTAVFNGTPALACALCGHRSRWLNDRFKPESKKAGRKTGLFLYSNDTKKNGAAQSEPRHFFFKRIRSARDFVA